MERTEKEKEKMRFKYMKVAVFVFAAFLMAGMLITAERGEAAQKGGTLIYGTWQAPDNLDPQVTGLQITLAIGTQIHDPLLRQKQGDSKIYPGLAQSYKVSSDVTEYTFSLKKGVTFHDGTPFNAQAVKFSLDRLADPETRSGAARGALGPYDSCVVVDDYTVKVKFKKPFAGFLNMCCTVDVTILSPAAVKKWGDQYQFHVTGTGPFMLKEYVPNDHVALVKNPNYAWGPEWNHKGAAYLDGIIYRIIPEDLTRISSLKTGETNIIDNVRSHDIADLQNNPNVTVSVSPVAGAPWILLLNVQKFPTSEKAVRVAVEYAIDRVALCNLLYKGTNAPHYSPIEKITLGYDPAIDKIYSYDPEKAKKILDDAGWKAGADGIRAKDGKPLKLVWVIWSGGAMDEPAAVIQDQLRQIGVDAAIETYDVGTAFGKWNSGDLNIAMPFYVWADPMFMQSWYGSEYVGSINWAHVSDPELDKLLGKCETTPNVKERAAALKAVQKWLMENGVTVPLFGKSLALAMKKGIKGIEFEVTGFPVYFETSIER
jgi:peptide/nickel transport system substrate-binding protein